jgi:Leucine-rich repeat (LRR) protein
MLRSLYLNHNRIIVIDSIERLKSLKQLGLFHNQISDGPDTLRILKSLPKLKELSIDINPCSVDSAFNFEIVLTMEKLKMFNEEAVRELDKDVAR